ncbi:creatininase family protein [Planococcus lenghuensis]|uniref:Creatininase n=1 Tax=Planococcus lenghuensis TaxID=2213202 RepID=A0A1Q2L2N4_9BACL|nr:creatininase family protein [Planococcus lenghuensis]AQQ54689.1 creatininase [Planococcus lenghuensis]
MLSYRNSTTEVADSGTDTVIIPIGATEQFGPYLPMHIDTLIVGQLAEAYGNALGGYVLPALPFNTSEEHASLKGTVTISPGVIMSLLEEIIMNLHRQGFRKFIICSGHGGAYWEPAFVKQMNFKYPELLMMAPPYRDEEAQAVAKEAAGLEELKEMHGGLLSVCTAMWLCPELVTLESMGSDVPAEHLKFIDHVPWEKLTGGSGNWGKFTAGEYSKEELAEKGEKFWTAYTAWKCDGLKEYVEEAYARKMN